MHSLSAKISERIKEKIEEKKLTVQGLERKAGLKPSAVQNIIHGRSKHPSITLIQSVAKVLDCRIEDLIGQESNSLDPSVSPPKYISPSRQDNKNWNQELYLKCFDAVHFILNQQKITVEKNKILDLVDEIYDYSLGNRASEPDQHFANWLIKRIEIK